MALTITVGNNKKSLPVVKQAEKEDEYEQHLVSTPAKGMVTIEKKVAKSEPKIVKDVEENIHKGLIIPKEELIQLTCGGSATINLGNYESAKISVSLQMPTTKDTLDETYEFATSWVYEKMAAAVQEAKE